MKYRWLWFLIISICASAIIVATIMSQEKVNLGNYISDSIDMPEVITEFDISTHSATVNDIELGFLPEPIVIAEMLWNPSKARWEFCVMKPELVFIYLDGKEINLAEWMRKVVICEFIDTDLTTQGFEMERTDGKRLNDTSLR